MTKDNVITQENLDRAHKSVDRLIRLTEAARVQSCEAGDFVSRDLLDEINADLRRARAKAGRLNMGGVAPTTRGGDK